MPETLIWRSCFCVLYLFQVLKHLCGAWSPPWSSCLLSFSTITVPAVGWITSFTICCCIFHSRLMVGGWPALPCLLSSHFSQNCAAWSRPLTILCRDSFSNRGRWWVVKPWIQSQKQRGISQVCAHKTLVLLLWIPYCCFCHLESVLLVSSKRCNTFVNKGIDALQRSMQFVTHWGPSFCWYIC